MSVEDKHYRWFGILIVFILVCGIIVSITFFGISRAVDTEFDTEFVEVQNHVQDNEITDSFSNEIFGSSGSSVTFLVSDRLNFSDIFYYCSDPSTEPTDTCWQYLDRHFSVTRTGRKFWHWIEHHDHITFQSVFSDPLGDRRKVLDVLDNTECMVTDATNMRWNMSDNCNTAALLNFRQIRLWCTDTWDYSNRIDDWFKTEMIERLNLRLPSKFDSRHKAIEHMYPKGSYRRIQGLYDLWADALEARWIVKQCENFEVQKTIQEFEHDSYYVKRFQKIGLSLGLEPDFFSGEISLDDVLTELSMYLGNISAIINYGGSPEWLAYRDEQHPWIISNLELFETSNTRMEKMSKGIQTVMELEDTGIDYNLNLLVHHICTDQTVPDPDSCQTTIEALRTSLKPSEWRQQQLIDRIERIALDIGVYYDPDVDIPISRE
ncbi:MAG: hypothetical protein OXG88_07910 [Gammaproteobacteria bacterium]|nr:hypothetical protein [Gammaproteobacteria bacterium]